MRRRNLFTALLVAVGMKAQEPMAGMSDPKKGPWRMVRPWENYKPANGQCLVCGWQAPPFRRDNAGNVTSGWIGHLGYAVNLTRCWRCSNAFWQDVEGEAPRE